MSWREPARRVPGAPRRENALYLMEQHLRCLYVHDGEGRIHSTREPSSLPVPRFHLGRTTLGNLWRFREDLRPSVVRGLSRLAGKEAALAPGWPAHGRPPPVRIEALRSLLREDAEIAFEWRGPTYRFPQELPRDAPGDTPGSPGALEASPPEPPEGAPVLVAVVPGGEVLLERHFSAALPELSLRQPCFALVENGHAVSLCCCARSSGASPAAVGVGAAAEAWVETAPGQRGRGYAARTVAAWARSIRALGLEPLYSTSWENRASRAVARRLGLIPYGEDLHIA